MSDLDLTQDELEALMSEPPGGYPRDEHRIQLEIQAQSGLDTYAPHFDGPNS